MSKTLVTRLVNSMQKRPSSWEISGDRALQQTADDTICVFDGTITVLESIRPLKTKYPIWTTRFQKRALRKAVAALKEAKLLLMLDTAPLVLIADDREHVPDYIPGNLEKALTPFEPVTSFEDISAPTPDWGCPDYHKHGVDYTCPDCDLNWRRRAGQLI